MERRSMACFGRSAWCATAIVMAVNAWGQELPPANSKQVLVAVIFVPDGYQLWRVPRDPHEKQPEYAPFENAIAKGRYLTYSWPDDTVPEKIAGFKVIVGRLVHSMLNFGSPVVFESVKTKALVKIKCCIDIARGPSLQPYGPASLPQRVEAVEFHGLNAGVFALKPDIRAPSPAAAVARSLPDPATVPAKNTPSQHSGGFTPAPAGYIPGTASKGAIPPATTSNVEFVFQIGRPVVDISAESKTSPDDAWSAAREVGEAIYQFQKQSAGRVK